MSDQHYSLYVVRCADGSLYTGIAIDVARRLRQHQCGSRGAKYLRGRGPFELVFEQRLGDRGLAARAEHWVKQLDKAEKEALVAGDKTLVEIWPDAELAEA